MRDAGSRSAAPVAREAVPGRAAVALLLAVALAATACGTRVSRDEVVAASGAGGTAVGGAQFGVPGVPGPAGAAPPGAQPGASVPQAGVPGVPGTAPGAQVGVPGAQGGGTTSQAASGPPIVIGSVGNYSGPSGATLAAGPQALQIWARFINDLGGIAGHPIEVVVVDDGTDPARHQAAVKDIVENRGAIAFVAQLAPFTLPAAKDYLEKKRVPVVGGECSHTAWNQSPVFFPQCAEFITGLFGNLSVGARFGKSDRLGALTCVEAAACRDIKRFWFEEGMAEEAGLKPVYQADISIAQPDFTAECIGARNRDVGLMSVVADVNTVVRVANSCSRQGFFPQYLQGGGTTDQRLVGMRAFQGALVKVNVFPHLGTNTPETNEFAEAYRRYAPDVTPTASSALGWSAAKLFQKVATDAAARAGGRRLTSAMLLEALWALRDETLGGLVTPLTFERNKPSTRGRCWFMMQITGGRFTAPQGTRGFCKGS